MYKKVAVYFVLILFSGCTVFKTQNRPGNISKNYVNSGALKNRNLTNNSFYIQKAEVEIDSDGEKRNLLASIKFCKPDTFLISIRSKTGIEAARVFITDDTLIINDRINKTLYYGSGEDMVTKYGYNDKFLPLVFGDFVLKSKNENDRINCNDGVLIMEADFEGSILTYSIDCYSDKLIRVQIAKKIQTKPVIMEYHDAVKKDNVFYYSKVQVYNLKGLDRISLKYSKIDVPYKGYVEFIPGRNYEQVRIR